MKWKTVHRGLSLLTAGHRAQSLFTVIIFIMICDTYTVTSPQQPEFPREFDFRFTSYEDLLSDASSFNIFQHQDITGYVQLTVDVTRNQLLVGARGILFRLSLHNLTNLQTTEWRSDNETQELCTLQGQTESECQNFIRVLLLHEDKVIACGTNSFNPTCTWRSAEDLRNVTRTLEDLPVCPFNPYDNSTALMTSDENLYSATVTDITGRDSVIYRVFGNKPILRTARFNSKWLNEPDFVSSYEIGDFVYFFFREVAVEHINCGKKVYSRVARICNSDRGGQVLLEDNWTTYLKARMNCSLPGDYPFYFDEIQSTFLLETEDGEKYLYALFTTPMNSIAGSAICVYNMTSFNNALTGPYKYQETARSAWERRDNFDPLIQCPSDDNTNKRTVDDDTLKKSAQQMLTAQQFQMMDLAVQPKSIHPTLVGKNERWTHVAVDHVEGKENMYTVIYIATDGGNIRKMIKLPFSRQTCLLEEIKIVPNGHKKPVKSLKISKTAGALFAGTHEKVFRIPLYRCDRFTDLDLCLNAMDPYCGWNKATGKCSPAPDGMPGLHYWDQVVNLTCPIVAHPVDGQWSNWTQWLRCQQMGADPSLGSCLCRTRSCDNPKPLYGGQTCQGAGVEVTNCTAHGQWTLWTSWSSCSISCGHNGTRSRQRYCSNPPPRFGGNNCLGISRDEGYCPGNPGCPEPPVDGNWAPWSEWTDCTAKCNGGIQSRRRACNNPIPNRGGSPCEGNREEWRMCNTYGCDEVHRMTPWSPWVKTNSTPSGYVEQRFRFMCRANVPDIKMIKASQIQNHVRFCNNEGQTCHRPDDMRNISRHGNWSEWSEWTKCTNQCGGGHQSRKRSCDKPRPIGLGRDCEGESRELRTCNSHSCRGEWSCWSKYSSCSVTCGRGTRVRVRRCKSSVKDTTYTLPCYGAREDVIICYENPCNETNGWDIWSPWTQCGIDGIQYRHRTCHVRYPKADQCQGYKIASRSCISSKMDIKVQSVKQGENTERTFTVIHLGVVGGTAFLFGILCTIGLYLCIKSFRNFRKFDLEKERRKQEIKNKSRKSSFASQLSLDFLSINNKIYDCSTLPLPKERQMKRDNNSFKKTNSHNTLLKTDTYMYDL